jgi:anti-sigma factor RsiW
VALDAHLAACPACAAEAGALAELLGAARLPPLSAQEERRISELHRALPPPRRSPPLWRWAGISAALAASALLGLHVGAGRDPAPRRAQAPIAAPAAVQAWAVSGSGSALDDPAEEDAFASFDPESDSALYDAVVFQGGAMPFDLDG